MQSHNTRPMQTAPQQQTVTLTRAKHNTNKIPLNNVESFELETRRWKTFLSQQEPENVCIMSQTILLLNTMMNKICNNSSKKVVTSFLLHSTESRPEEIYLTVSPTSFHLRKSRVCPSNTWGTSVVSSRPKHA